MDGRRIGREWTDKRARICSVRPTDDVVLVADWRSVSVRRACAATALERLGARLTNVYIGEILT